MPAPATIAELLDLSQKSGILDKKGVDDYLQRKRKESVVPSAPEELAEAMVRDGLLTRFQAEQLLQGKWRNFLIANKYKLLERLGEGGMGAVFLCEHVRLRRRVALKVLPPDQADNAGVIERFEREARAVAALDHPNIVKVHDVDQEEKKDKKLHYLVMEYVEGASLQDIVRKKGPMDHVRAAHYILQAALGLHHAHEAGLVHRDVKPGNILLDRGGVVKVLDLGLARFFNDQGDNLTREHDANSILGTADYLAPEQAINSHDVDSRADIYSLGMTLYYLLAGQAPFAHGTLNQKLIWHQLRQPEPLAARRPDVPPELTAVLARMIAKDPAERFQTALEVAQALAPWAETPIGPPPEDEMPELSPAALGGGPASSNGPLSAVGRRPASPTAASLALLSATSLRAGPPPPPRTDLHLGDTVPDTPTDIADAPTAPPGVDWETVYFWGRIAAFAVVLLGSAIGLTCWALSRSSTAQVATDKKDEDTPRRKTPDQQRGPGAWQPPPVPHLNLDSLGAIAVLGGQRGGHSGPVEHVAFSPDGKRAVSCSHDRVALVWEIATGQVLHRLAGHTGAVHDVAFSADGKQIVTASFDHTLRLWHVDSGRLVRTFTGHTAPVAAVAFSPNGKYILSGAGEIKDQQPNDCTLRLWETASGQQLRQFTGHTNAVWSIAFDPDGSRAVSASYDGTARVWNVLTGQEICRFSAHEGQVHAAAFSPDGRRVATGGGDGMVRLWSPADGKQERVLTGHTATIAGVAFSADGKHVLSASDDRSVRLWDADSGRQVGTFLGHTQSAWGVCFAPSGRLALSCGSDHTVRLWGLPRFVEVVRGGLLHQFHAAPRKITALAVSPDGHLLLAAGEDRIAYLWGLEDGNALRRFPGHTDIINAVAFSPDGRLLATASRDHSVRLWDRRTGQEKARLATPAAVRGAAFTPDGRFVLGAGEDGVVRLWDAGSAKQVAELRGHAGPVNGVAVSPDGRLVLTADADGTARVWDLGSRKEQRSFKGHKGAVQAVAFAPDGRLALSAGADRTLRLWEVATGKAVRTIPLAADVGAAAFSPDGRRVLAAGGGVWQTDGKLVQGFVGHQGAALAAAFTPDGRRAVSAGVGGVVRVWGLPRPTAVIGEVRRYEGHRQTLDRAAISPDGRYALSCGLDQPKPAAVVLWEVASGLEVRRYPHPAGVRFVTFTPDGDHFLSCAEDGKARLWEVAGGKEVRRFEGHRGTVWWAAFTKDGQRLFTGGGDHTARLWDVATGKELKRFDGHQGDINSVAVTPDGRRGLTASWDKTVRVWDLETGKEVQCFRGHTAEARAVAVSPDGKLAVSAGSDRVLRLWEIETGRPVREFAGHTGEVYFVDFSPDGKRVVSGGVDRCVRLWDAVSGVPVHIYGGHEKPIPAVVFTPDGRFALSVSQDQTLRLWGLPPQK